MPDHRDATTAPDHLGSGEHPAPSRLHPGAEPHHSVRCDDRLARVIRGRRVRLGMYSRAVPATTHRRWFVALTPEEDEHPQVLLPTGIISRMGMMPSREVRTALYESLGSLLASVFVEVVAPEAPMHDENRLATEAVTPVDPGHPDASVESTGSSSDR